jgi:hypothetical protein
MPVKPMVAHFWLQRSDSVDTATGWMELMHDTASIDCVSCQITC